MDIRDLKYRGMQKLAIDRKDEILALQAENKRLKELLAYSIDTLKAQTIIAEEIEQTLKV